ncbi:flavin reductase family protein [Klebsiella quasipneumoniae]|nr:flavin reductase family protein [Klebsiella quasipneumoniae]NGX22314.1 flavin reductase family protein [Klebsiella quasipneumoniae]
MNNENNLRTFLRLIAWRIVARWMTNEGLKMTMTSTNIHTINKLNNTYKGKIMSVQAVELRKAYRLLQVGSTTMISAKYDGVENVMSAAWVGLAGERKVVAYIGTQAFTRQLVEKSGYFVVQIPVVSQMATVLYAGGRSYADAPDKNDTIPFFYQPGFDLPLVAGCAGWLVCKVMPYPDIQQQHNLFMGDIVAPGAMTGYSATDTGSLMMHRTNYGPFTMSQAGSSMSSAKAANSIMDRVRTDPSRSCRSLTRCLRGRAADTPAPDAGRLAILALEAAVEGLLGVKAEGDRHVEDRLVAVG